MNWLIIYIIVMSAMAIFTGKKLYAKKKASGHVQPFSVKDAFKKEGENQEDSTTKNKD